MRAAVAGEQEARQRRGEHDRIAHDHVAGRLADLVLRPGDRHDARRAGKGRNVELRPRAVPSGFTVTMPE